MKKLLFAVIALSVLSINAYAKEKWELKSVLSSSALQPGRSWTYKMLFLGSKGDTTDTMTAKVEILAEDTFLHTQPSEWKYENLTEPAKIVGNASIFTVTPPVKGNFESFNLYIPAYCMKKLDTVTIIRKPTAAELALKEVESKKPLAVHPDEVVETPTDTTKPDTTKQDVTVIKSLKEWELDGGIVNGEFIKINYFPQLARKTIATLMQSMPECLEIKAERKKLKRVENIKKEDLKAVFYFNDKYGFVRWEYTRPDGSQVIFDLAKVSGF